MNSTVLFVVSIPAILAIVNLLKGVGLAGKWSALVAVLVAVLLNVANFYLAASGGYQAIMGGLILGLSAAGLYDASSASPTPTK